MCTHLGTKSRAVILSQHEKLTPCQGDVLPDDPVLLVSIRSAIFIKGSRAGQLIQFGVYYWCYAPWISNDLIVLIADMKS